MVWGHFLVILDVNYSWWLWSNVDIILCWDQTTIRSVRQRPREQKWALLTRVVCRSRRWPKQQLLRLSMSQQKVPSRLVWQQHWWPIEAQAAPPCTTVKTKMWCEWICGHFRCTVFPSHMYGKLWLAWGPYCSLPYFFGRVSPIVYKSMAS